MYNLIEKVIRARNPQFRFDKSMTNHAFYFFVLGQLCGVLRGLKLMLYFKKPKMAILGKRVSLYNSPKIKYGRFMKLGNDVRLSALGREGIILGNNVSIGSFSQLIVSSSLNNIGSYIKIEDNVGIGEFAYLGGAGGLEIGKDCIIGQYFSCHPENHNTLDLCLLIRLQGVSRQGIKIGKNCWIGSKVSILDGVEIGDGCVIAAGAVVTKSFPSNSVIGGVPAKILKTRI